MTRKEAIQVLKDWDGYFIGHGSDDVNEALNMAIKELEKESILDKIRAEIKEERDSWDKWDGDEADYYYSYNKCLEIIDKYKAESEDKE